MEIFFSQCPNELWVRPNANNVGNRMFLQGEIDASMEMSTGLHLVLRLYLYCGRVPAANAPGCTAAEGLLYKPWSLVVPTCTARCLHQRP